MVGVLIMSRHHTRYPFEENDLSMISAFSAHAALAVEYSRAQDDRHRLLIFEDRDRIARDLHDLVIQRLFSIGLGLRGLSRVVIRPEVRDRVNGFVEALDQTIRDIRRSIFSLQEPSRGPLSLRGELVRVVDEATVALGFAPGLALEGALDTLVPDDMRADVVATLREALSNAARHARAEEVRATVSVNAEGTTAVVRVVDDGMGLPERLERRSGLANLTERATRWRGHCAVDSRRGAGTTLTWTVPLREPDCPLDSGPSPLVR